MKTKRILKKDSKLKCVFCRGKGIQPGSERLSCIVCRGTGKIQMSQPYDVCKECGGNGRTQSTNLHCLLCKGKGVIEREKSVLEIKLAAPKTTKKKRKIKRRKAVKKSIKHKKIIKRPTKKKKTKSFLAGLLSYLGIL